MDLFFMIKENVFFIFILVCTQAIVGKTETECDATGGTILKCKFPENISSTQTGFTVYFDSEDDSAELLVDCVWMHQNLECIEQEGFKCNQPVSDTALINVPLRYMGRSGTYRCIPEGSNDKDIKPCRCPNSQLGQQSENQNKREKEKHQDTSQHNTNTNHSDEKEDITAVLIGSILGPSLGLLALMLLFVVLSKKVFKRNLQNLKSERSSLGSPSNEKDSCNIIEIRAKDVECTVVMSDVSVTSSQQEYLLEVNRENSLLLSVVVDNDSLSFVSE